MLQFCVRIREEIDLEGRIANCAGRKSMLYLAYLSMKGRMNGTFFIY